MGLIKLANKCHILVKRFQNSFNDENELTINVSESYRL